MGSVIDNRFYNGIQIAQRLLRQRHNGCGFAAVARHIEYMIRLGYAGHPLLLRSGLLASSTHPEAVRSGMLVDPYRWQDELSLRYPAREIFTIVELMREAQQHGVPLWDGRRIYIEYFVHILRPGNGSLPVEHVRQTLRDHGCFVGVITITTDYPLDASRVYIGGGAPTQFTHAVVILGEYEGEYQGRVVNYWVYQDSNGTDPNSYYINLVESTLLIEGYVAITHFPQI